MTLQPELVIMDLQLDLIKCERDIAKSYDPNEARDIHGRWATGPGGSNLQIHRLQIRLVEVARALQNPSLTTETWDKLSNERQQIESKLNLQPLGPDYIYGDGTRKLAVRQGLLMLPNSERAKLKGIRVEHQKYVTIPGMDSYFAGLAWGSHKIQVADVAKVSGRDTMLADISGVTIHEVGHIRDIQLGYPSTGFDHFVKQDASTMSSEYQGYAKYYLSNKEEMFAETYRTALGSSHGSSFGIEGGLAKYIFRKSVAQMHKVLGL